jgi:hypothetical protein
MQSPFWQRNSPLGHAVEPLLELVLVEVEEVDDEVDDDVEPAPLLLELELVDGEPPVFSKRTSPWAQPQVDASEQAAMARK